MTCTAKWNAYKNTELTGNVHSQLSSQHKLQVKNNKKYLSMLIDIALLLSSQGLAFRGHNESNTSINQGKIQ